MIRRDQTRERRAIVESLTTGTMAGAGTFRCEMCGQVVTMASAEALPPCPHCGGRAYARASLFGTGPVAVAPDPVAVTRAAALVEHARDAVTEPGPYLAWEERGEVRIAPVPADKPTSLGRSLSADVRFDDATVSRRHALVMREGAQARVLDDRSLNGVFVNGERVSSRVLEDGDEVVVGRYHLRFIVVPAAALAEPAADRKIA
jgi:predicted  nucleic acid-binding Zn-ribbon protein